MEQFCSHISEGDKAVKRKALETLRSDFLKKESADRSEFLDSELKTIKCIVNCLYDKFDSCRELSVEILDIFIDNVDIPEIYPFLIPALEQRLGTEPLQENSEEVRLAEVKLLCRCIEKQRGDVAPYYENILAILKVTLLDANPDVRIHSCQCTVLLATHLSATFHYQSESLIKPLLVSISHQRFRVRVSVIEAIGAAILHGNNHVVKDVVAHLAQRLFDRVPQVRLAVVRTVGRWLIDLPDRYSYFSKLIPLILTGLLDEVEEVKDAAVELWNEAGSKYLEENRDEYKEQIDLGDTPLQHYPPVVERPSFGCRILTAKNIYQVIPILVDEMDDWMTETREKSLQLLFSILLHAEKNITQSLPSIVRALQNAYRFEEEKKLMEWVHRCTELVGYFVEVETWKPLVLEPVKESPTAEGLQVLAHVMRGTEPVQLKLLLKQIADIVSNKSVCRNMDGSVLAGISAVLSSALDICKEDCKQVLVELFTALVTVVGLSQSEIVRGEAVGLLDDLAKLSGYENRDLLFTEHMEGLLEELKETSENWRQYSYEYLIFQAILVYSGNGLGDHLETVISVLKSCIRPENNVEMRLRLMTLVAELLAESSVSLNSQGKLPDFIPVVVQDILLPELRWCPGRTAAALRSAAMCGVWSALCCPCTSDVQLETIKTELVTSVVGLLRDDTRTTRLLANKSFEKIFKILGHKTGEDVVVKVYPELLGRLDDVMDDVRIAAIRSLRAVKHTGELDPSHYRKIFSILLIHLDDKKVNKEVQEALTELGSVEQTILQEELEKRRSEVEQPAVYKELSDALKRSMVIK